MQNQKKHNIISCLIYLYLFSIIYQSGSVRAAVVFDGILFKATRILALVLPLVIVLRFFDGKIRKQYLAFLVGSLCIGGLLVIITYFKYSDGVFQLFYKIVSFIEAGLFYLSINDRTIGLRKYIYKTIFVIALITLVIYIPIEIFKFSFPYSWIYGSGYNYRNYYEIFFTYHYMARIPRLSGLFWEPGMYQIYLNFALFLYILLNRKSKFELGIILLNILFSQSTSGYCCAVILVAVMIANSKHIKKKNRKILYILGLVMATVVVSFLILEKKAATNIIGNSYSLRMLDILNGMKVFMTSPLIGIGFGNSEPFVKMDMFGRGSSNGLISWLYMTGVIGFSIFLYPFIRRIVKSKGNQKIMSILWFVLILIENMTEPIYNLLIMAFILGVEYSRIHCKKVRKEEIELRKHDWSSKKHSAL